MLSIQKEIYKWERIVPICFARAVTGPPQRYAPDIDDRGGKWNQISVTMGDTNKAKIIRENIDDSAILYVSSSDVKIVKIGGLHYHNSILLTFEKEIIIDFKGVSPGNAKIEVRFGNPSGVIIAELNVYVVDEICLYIIPHFVKIPVPGRADKRTIRDINKIQNLLILVNDIWRPCGIQFKLYEKEGKIEKRETYINKVYRSGAITVDTKRKYQFKEFETLLRKNRLENAINIYFVTEIHDEAGEDIIGICEKPIISNQPNNYYGICLSDAADGSDFAHELGHLLNLPPDWTEEKAHAEDDRTNKKELPRNDIWTLRRLMYGKNTIPEYLSWVADEIGYGTKDVEVNGKVEKRAKRGALITIKNLPNDTTDGELIEARKQAKTLRDLMKK